MINKKFKRKLLAGLMAASLIASAVPVGVLAEEAAAVSEFVDIIVEEDVAESPQDSSVEMEAANEVPEITPEAEDLFHDDGAVSEAEVSEGQLQEDAVSSELAEEAVIDNQTLTDFQTGVAVTFPEGSLPEEIGLDQIQLQVEPLTDEQAEAVEQVLLGVYPSNFYFQPYDITLYNFVTGEIVEPVAPVEVRIPLSEEYVKNARVFYVDDAMQSTEELEALCGSNEEIPVEALQMYSMGDELFLDEEYAAGYAFSDEAIEEASVEEFTSGEEKLASAKSEYSIVFQAEHFSTYVLASGIERLATATQTNLINGSFEAPVKYTADTGYSIFDASQSEGWYTTATDNRMEYGWIKSDGKAPHMDSNYTPTMVVPHGAQFIELASSDYSALYQDINLAGEKSFFWSLKHRARFSNKNNQANEYDSMAVIIGPKQEYEASRNSTDAKTNRDQFRKILLWAVANNLLTIDGLTNMLSGAVTVYTPKFAADSGNFAGSVEAFSTTKTETCTEKWSIQLMRSNASEWHKYSGSYSAEEGVSNLVFAMVPYMSVLSPATYSCGNLVDNVSAYVGGNEKITNGSFESPKISGSNATRDIKAEYGWKCASGKIELGRLQETSPYIVTTTINRVVDVKDGKQYAELNANEPSTLFQYVHTTKGKVYEWGMYHRAREVRDTLALVIGPRQEYDPIKTDVDSADQMMRIVDWIKQQGDIDVGLDIYNFKETGCSKKIILYSSKFGPNGTFENEENPFSWTQDEIHTEQWNLWIMTSACDKWYSYGSIDPAVNYDYTYKVPERADGDYDSIFAFVSFNSGKNSGTPVLSFGNLLDCLTFQEFYRVECYTTPSGNGTYLYQSTNDFTYDQNYIGYIPGGQTFTVTAREYDGDANRKFIGARINGAFVPVTDPGWVSQPDGTYVYTSPDVNQHYEVRLIFAAQKVVYDVNGGDSYHYDINDLNTGHEVALSREKLEYTSHPATKADNDGWRFEGWKYAQSNRVYKGEHTIKYINNGGEDPAGDTLSIWEMDETGTLIEGEGNIPESVGITMIAQWTYRQAAIPQVYDKSTGTFVNSQSGGTVNISGTLGKILLEDEGVYHEVGEYLFAENHTEMKAEAIPKDGHRFLGWYDGSGNLVSSNTIYQYTIANREVTELYARFERSGYDINISKNVTGVSADPTRYFAVTFSVSGAKAFAHYSFAGYNTGKLTVDGVTCQNPRILETDGSGKGSAVVYICHGETITLKGMPAGAAVEVNEKDYRSIGYTTIYSNNLDNTDAHSFTLNDTISGNVDLHITNENNNVYNVNISKNVTGSMGDKSRYFKVNVSVKNARPSTPYTIQGASSGELQVDGQTKTNPTALTTDANGSGSAEIYICHGERISLIGLERDVKVKVSEANYLSSGYITSYTIDNTAGNEEITIANSNVNVEIENNKNMVVPTGQRSNKLPWIFMLGAAIAGIGFLFVFKRKRIHD